VVKHIPVLLVEDNPGDARLISMMLAETPSTHFELAHVTRMTAALKLLAEKAFGVVLLDLSLPDSHGLDTFHQMRSRTAVPVVVLTGLDDETVAIQAVQDGAQDYLVKGRVNSERLIHALCYAVGRSQRQGKLEAEVRALEQEQRIVRDIYHHLLPAEAPQHTGWDIHGASLCVGAAGGDYFDYLLLGNDRLGVVIGDVTGHGIGPALLMAATRAYLRVLAQTCADIGTMLGLANRLLAQDVSDGRNVTLLLGQIDLARRTLIHTSAGHPPGYVLARDGTVRAFLYSTGPPLGILPDADYAPTTGSVLEPGDVLLLVTDGVLEARDPTKQQMFGRDRTLDVIRAHRRYSAREMVETLCEAVQNFAQGRPQLDDITVIVIRVSETA
jgi:serine phosphatase RsbU (regulator of sigma subunit)